MTRFALDLPDSLLDGAKAAAARDGTTVEQLLTLAIAEKLSALDAEELIATRAARADAQAYRAILDGVPDVPPAAGDELPNP